MARRTHKKPRQQKHESTASDKRSLLPIGLLISILVTVVLAGIPFGLGKYIELNSPGPFDSGAFVYSAKHLLNGAQLGVDELSSARPNTLLANVIGVKLFGFNDRGPKIVQMLMQLAALVFMFWTARKVFGNIAAILSTTLAALYLSAPLIAKLGNVKEQFMIPFMIAAACCFCWYKLTQKRLWLILTGFMALQPYFSKPTGMSIVFAIGLYIFISNIATKSWKKLLYETGLFLAGYTAGLIIPGSLYLWQKQPAAILTSFPAVATQLAAVLLAISAGTVYGIKHFKKYQIPKQQLKVSKRIWLTGLILMVLAPILAVGLVRIQPGYLEGDIGSYLNSTFPAKIGAFFNTQYLRVMRAAGLSSGYVAGSRSAKSMADVAPQIFRYYKALIVPILGAVLSIIIAAIIWLPKLIKKNKPTDIQSGLVWLLAIWWILDMAFIWISPRSYEQYYLPLCASAAMLSSFAVWAWTQRIKTTAVKVPWFIAGAVTIIVLGTLTIPIFIGQRYSPDTGTDYTKNNRPRRRGFAESLKRVKTQGVAPWQAVGDYIRAHSTEDDTIYVWGWVPGIYVQAQRLSSYPKAYEGDMHVTPPFKLIVLAGSMVREFEKKPPRFIVDSRKVHFPNDRPPLELWPHMYSKQSPLGQPIPSDPTTVAQYDAMYAKMLTEKFDPRQKEYAAYPGLTCWWQPNLLPWTKAMPDEAKRYEAMKPFRDYVMKNYRIVGNYGYHVLFERK